MVDFIFFYGFYTIFGNGKQLSIIVEKTILSFELCFALSLSSDFPKVLFFKIKKSNIIDKICGALFRFIDVVLIV